MYIYTNRRRLYWACGTRSGNLQIDSIELKNYRGKLILIETRKKSFCVFTKIFCWSDCWEEKKTAPDQVIFKFLFFYRENEKILKWIFSFTVRRKLSRDREKCFSDEKQKIRMFENLLLLILRQEELLSFFRSRISINIVSQKSSATVGQQIFITLYFYVMFWILLNISKAANIILR